MAIAINVLKFFPARVIVYVFPLLVRFYLFSRTTKCVLHFIKRLCLSNL